MKKNLLKFGTLLIVSLMIACSGGEGPKAVAEKFLKESGAQNFDAAKKYCTEDTKKLLDMMAGFAKMGDKKDKKEPKFTMGEEKIDGDKATVTYKEDGKDGDQSVKLVKKDGNWLVDISKDDMSKKDGGAPKGGMDTPPPADNAMPAEPDTAKKKK